MPGVEVRQDYRCAVCGYGAVARAAPSHCPMCHSAAWELAPWRPFPRRVSPRPPAVAVERARRERPPVEAGL
jgi:hypothetical protein